MLEGEYCGMLEINQTLPSLIPRPFGTGRFCRENASIHFLLSDFIKMSEGLPEPVKLSKCIASLQRKSVSSTGKFNFFTPLCHGNIPQHVAWDSSWTSFFAKLLDNALQNDLETNGSSPVFGKAASKGLEQGHSSASWCPRVGW